MNRYLVPAWLALAMVCAAGPGFAAPSAHNAVLFVADGLRYESVTPDIAPTLSRVKTEGVDFRNSHALYPTLTTANASAIATGDYLGNTGDYANVLFTGFPVKAKGDAPVVFLEDDAVLREMKAHFGQGYMGPVSLVCAAQAAGFVTAIVGKVGPAAIQGLSCLEDIIEIDDATGHPANEDGSATGAAVLDPDLLKKIAEAAGAKASPKAGVPNTAQQDFFLKAATEAVLPQLKANGKPFLLVFWSRDPDGSQHGEDDAPGSVTPGINGKTAHAGIANADRDLKGLLDALAAQGLASSTDVFVTADHGFSTIAKSLPDSAGNLPPASHPSGFLALDVARWLGQKLFDPDAHNAELHPGAGEHPSHGSALIGPAADAPEAIVAANGGSDLIYVPGADRRAVAKRIYDALIRQPYVSSVFLDDSLFHGRGSRDFAGALPLPAIGLLGSAEVPRPTMIVGFRSFDAKGCLLGPELCAVEIADTPLQVGQGMHGSFSRADTRNFMAAMGPDFKAGYIDQAPVGNQDITPTLAHVLHLTSLPAPNGRIIGEALTAGADVSSSRITIRAKKAPSGFQTVLKEQQVGATVYFDAAGNLSRTVGLSAEDQ